MRTILHSDLNNFYASVECLRNPEIRDKPVVVVGSKEDRHGIVLAKNLIAKRAGVATGDVWWEAQRKCGPELVEVKADFAAYLDVSRAVRRIYEDYTDKIEAFGIDECWLDVTESEKQAGGEEIAHAIRRRIKKELGLTVSIGVSWNKVFAKLGSDMNKPDAVTVISPDNFRQTVWTLPAEELLYVGRATKGKLNRMGIFTIGELANSDRDALKHRLGKWGEWLHDFANGKDSSRVVKTSEEQNVKSIGNSLTVWRDLKNREEVSMVIFMLADSVAARMRESGLFLARTAHIFRAGQRPQFLSQAGQASASYGRRKRNSPRGAQFVRQGLRLGNACERIGRVRFGFSFRRRADGYVFRLRESGQAEKAGRGCGQNKKKVRQQDNTACRCAQGAEIKGA